MRAETRHSIVVTIGTGATAAISLLYAIYAARKLGPDEYGDFGAAVGLSSMLCLVLGPINGTVAKFSAQYAARGEYGKVRTLYVEIIRRAAWIGALALIVASLASGPVARVLKMGTPATIVVCYALVYVTLLLSVARGLLRGVQRFGPYNVNIVFESAVRLVAGVVLLHWVAKAPVGLAAYVVSVVATLALSAAQMGRVWAGHPHQSVDGSAIRRFALPMFLLAFGGGGFLYLDVLIVKHFFPPVEAGLYAAAANLANTISVVGTPFHIILLPMMTALHEQGARSLGTFLRVLSYLLALSVVVIAVFAIWPKWLITLLLGAEYAGAAPYLAWITGGRLLAHLVGLVTTIPISRGNFSFLRVYLAGLAVEVIALMTWHETLDQTVVALVVVQGLTLAGLACVIFERRRALAPARGA